MTATGVRLSQHLLLLVCGLCITSCRGTGEIADEQAGSGVPGNHPAVSGSPLSFTISPNPAPVLFGSQTQQFAAKMGGADTSDVTWSLSYALGSISATGLYTVPAQQTGWESVVVTATSTSNHAMTASTSQSVAPMPGAGASAGGTGISTGGGIGTTSTGGGIGTINTGGGNGTTSGTGGGSGTTSSTGGGTAAGTVAVDTNVNTYNLGINVCSLNYYNNCPIYADMTLQMAGNNGPWDSGSVAAALDAHGNPTVNASAFVTSDYPSGAYSVAWDGTGTVRVTGATLGAVTVTQASGGQHNTATLSLTQTPSAWLTVAVTTPISNFHIMAPAALFDASGFFIQSFFSQVKAFSTFRFMDTLNTNNQTALKNWSQRTWPTGGSRAGTVQGIAYEDIIAFANATGKDVWINVPALATDDYVCRLARLFHYGEQGDKSDSTCNPSASAGTATTAPLGPNTKLYVEFSNEIWNSGFQQWHDVFCMVWGVPDYPGGTCSVTAPTSAIAVAALAKTSLPWDDGNTYDKASQLAALFTKRDSDMFRTVFGCQSGASCQVKILHNVQAASPVEVDSGFTFLKTVYGSVSAIVDDMAVAPYFNIDDTANASTVDGIFANLDSTVLASVSSSGNAIVNWLKADLLEANKFGLPLIAYEGGQGLYQSQTDNTTQLIAAQHDPRMFTETQKAFALWSSVVGRKQLFVYYDYIQAEGQYGTWGALVNQSDPGSQKADALLSLARPPGDANLDGVVDPADCAILEAHYKVAGTWWWMQGDFNHDNAVDDRDVAILNANISAGSCSP